MLALKDQGLVDAWVVPAHVERAWSYWLEYFRAWQDAGSDVAIGFEGAPGHQTSSDRGFGRGSLGGGTYGGTGFFVATDYGTDAAVIETFYRKSGKGKKHKNGHLTYTLNIRPQESMFIRLRGTNLPAGQLPPLMPETVRKALELKVNPLGGPDAGFPVFDTRQNVVYLNQDRCRVFRVIICTDPEIFQIRHGNRLGHYRKSGHAGFGDDTAMATILKPADG